MIQLLYFLRDVYQLWSVLRVWQGFVFFLTNCSTFCFCEMLNYFPCGFTNCLCSVSIETHIFPFWCVNLEYLPVNKMELYLTAVLIFIGFIDNVNIIGVGSFHISEPLVLSSIVYLISSPWLYLVFHFLVDCEMF